MVFSSFRIMLLSTTLLVLQVGCASLQGQGDLQRARTIADRGQLRYDLADTPPFVLTRFARINAPDAPLLVFLEGDGHAWRSRSEVSPDPTPDRPVALELAAQEAAAHPKANVLYLARPCQYTPFGMNPACRSEYWTSRRYAEEVVAATQAAIDQAVLAGGTRGVSLLGYSGGAALAALVAVRRHDVLSLQSVAGNLDPEELNRFHGVSPLRGLDAAATAPQLASIPQIHWIGGRDAVVPPQVAQSWLQKSGDTNRISIRVVKQASHVDGWSEYWASGTPIVAEAVPADAVGRKNNNTAVKGRQAGDIL